jgi:hypothetical protein
VLVLSPHHHRELLEHVYNVYEDRGGYEMNYEMRPLSFEIQEKGLQHWLDNRFNAIVYLLDSYSHLVQKKPPLTADWQKTAFLKEEYARNYFLHFAGTHHLMRLLPTNSQYPASWKPPQSKRSVPLRLRTKVQALPRPTSVGEPERVPHSEAPTRAH